MPSGISCPVDPVVVFMQFVVQAVRKVVRPCSSEAVVVSTPNRRTRKSGQFLHLHEGQKYSLLVPSNGLTLKRSSASFPPMTPHRTFSHTTLRSTPPAAAPSKRTRRSPSNPSRAPRVPRPPTSRLSNFLRYPGPLGFEQGPSSDGPCFCLT